MFKLTGTIFKDNRPQKHIICTKSEADTRTHKVMHALEQICYQLDISFPIWLESNITQFRRTAKTRFYQDSFIEAIDFDYLEIHVLEED